MAGVQMRMRPYAWVGDRAAMADLVRAYPAGHVHLVDLPYRLASWAFDDPRQVGLWEDGAGRLLAWAVLQTPFWTLDYAYSPAARDLGILPQILTWAIARAGAGAGEPGGRSAWVVAVRADQAGPIGDLERAGFVRQDTVPADPWSQVLLARPADPVPAPELPASFRIRPLAGPGEVAAAEALHRAAFGSENMTDAWRARILTAPEYRPDLDLVVEAPDGRLAAFCLAWLGPDEDGRPAGQIEPLGVHPAFQRLGLGRAVLRAALACLREHGATTLLVETDNYRDAAFALYTGGRLPGRPPDPHLPPGRGAIARALTEVVVGAGFKPAPAGIGTFTQGRAKARTALPASSSSTTSAATA